MPDNSLQFPRIIGHRGAMGHAPENTLAGIRRAAFFGLRWVEFDVALTRDNEPVLLHDETVNRTTDGKGRLAAMTLAELQTLDAGSWKSPEFAGERVPSLTEVFALLRELGLGANLEVKPTKGREAETGAIVARMVAAAWPEGLPRPLISSFQTAALAAARDAAPQIARGYLVHRLNRGWQQEAAALGCVSVHCSQRTLKREGAAEVRQAGYRLLSYTVNEAARARLLFDWGVEAVFTDYPDRLAAV
jgi:glycerophosphoryl diester phosphodiesterase